MRSGRYWIRHRQQARRVFSVVGEIGEVADSRVDRR